MDRKKLNIGLIVILVVIYGAVMYKYFGGGNTEVLEKETFVKTIPEEMLNPKRDFQLILGDRDPFLDRLVQTTYKKRNYIQTPPPIRKPGNQNISWPAIEYYGFLKSKSNEAKRAILKINGKRHNKRQGEKIGELKIIHIYSDSIIVAILGHLKMISKNTLRADNNTKKLALDKKY